MSDIIDSVILASEGTTDLVITISSLFFIPNVYSMRTRTEIHRLVYIFLPSGIPKAKSHIFVTVE